MSRITRKAKWFFGGESSVQNIQVDAARKAVFISQTTDFHFANYRFPFCFVSFCFIPFRLVPLRFVPFRFANYNKPSDCLQLAECHLGPLQKQFLQYCANVIRGNSPILDDNQRNFVWSNFSTIFFKSYCLSDGDILLQSA